MLDEHPTPQKQKQNTIPKRLSKPNRMMIQHKTESSHVQPFNATIHAHNIEKRNHEKYIYLTTA